MAEVFHRIYTHAALDSFDSTGGRAVPLGERDVAAVLPELVSDIDELLRKTTPEAHGTAWVVRRFVSGGSAYGCVITSYPDLIQDAAGREGVLNHARLVRVGANEATFDIAQLVATAAEFPIEDVCQAPAARRLADYLDAVSGEQAVEVRPVSIEVLDQLPREFLRDFLSGCLAGIGARKAMRYVVPRAEGGSIDSLATAWAALPIGLQTASSFAYGVADGCPVDAIFSNSGSSSGTVREPLADCVTRYLHLLLDTSYDSQALLRSTEITSVSKLEQVVSNAETPGKKAMKKTKKRDDWVPPQNEAAPEVDRQYRAMEQSLRDYIDRRFAMLEPRQVPPGGMPAQFEGGRVPRSNGGSWLPWLVGVVVVGFVIALFVFLVLFKPQRASGRDERAETQIEEQRSTSTPTETVQSISANRKTLQDAIARANASGKWADELKNILTDHPTLSSSAVRAAAYGDMQEQSRTLLERAAGRIESGADLGSNGREALRALLLDAIAASLSDSNVTVDGTLTDLTPELLDRVNDRFHVAASANASSFEYQAEVILRWMEYRES